MAAECDLPLHYRVRMAIISTAMLTKVARDLPLTDFGDCTGGGLWTVAHPEDPEVLIAQYGSQGGSECLYQINLKSLAITKVYALPTAADDAHGIAFCKVVVEVEVEVVVVVVVVVVE